MVVEVHLSHFHRGERRVDLSTGYVERRGAAWSVVGGAIAGGGLIAISIGAAVQRQPAEGLEGRIGQQDGIHANAAVAIHVNIAVVLRSDLGDDEGNGFAIIGDGIIIITRGHALVVTHVDQNVAILQCSL